MKQLTSQQEDELWTLASALQSAGRTQENYFMVLAGRNIFDMLGELKDVREDLQTHRE